MSLKFRFELEKRGTVYNYRLISVDLTRIKRKRRTRRRWGGADYAFTVAPVALIVFIVIVGAWRVDISVPAGETRVLKHFQEPMPYGLFVPDVS
jgi:hypothetical protein